MGAVAVWLLPPVSEPDHEGAQVKTTRNDDLSRQIRRLLRLGTAIPLGEKSVLINLWI